MKKSRTTADNLRSDSQAFALIGMDHEQILEVMLPDLQKICSEFYNSNPRTYLELEDLIQEASIAAHEFIIINDLESTVSFKTHLLEYAKNAIANAYFLSIPITPKELERVKEYQKFLNDFFEQEKRIPERDEIINHHVNKFGDSIFGDSSFDKQHLEYLKQYHEKEIPKLVERKIIEYLKKIQSDSALLENVSIQDADPKYQVDPSKTPYEQASPSLFMDLLWKSMQQYVEKRKGLSNLSARKKIFCALAKEYYGFNFREISEMLKINNQSQVQEHEAKGMRQLREMLREKEVGADFMREY